MQEAPRTPPSPGAPRVLARAQATLERVDFARNPYLVALADGSMPLEAFQATQEQFFFAVEFFSRPMAALVARIPDPARRLDVLHNLLEEHGDLDPARFHVTTFRAFLAAIGADPGRLATLELWPEVRAFNSVLLTACVHDQLEVGVGCMGIVEHAFAGISAAIGRAVVARGWVSAGRLVHYKLHEEIDERHAEELYRVIEPSWDEGPLRHDSVPRRYYVEQGLELGAYVFDRLYRDLWARARA